MKSYNLLSDMNRSMGRILKTQQDLATTKRIHKPSDDPAGTARIMRLKSSLLRYERYEKNVDDGYNYLVSAESGANQVIDVIQSADSIMLRAAGDTMGGSERKILAGQMKELWGQLVQLSNVKLGGKYIFGGTNNETPPYSRISTVTDEAFTSSFDQEVKLENVDLEAGSVVVSDGTTTFKEGTAAEGGDYSLDYDQGTITIHSSGTMANSSSYNVSYETDEPVIAVLNPQGVGGDINRVIDEGVLMKINVAADSLFGGTDGLMKHVRDTYIALYRNEKDGISELRDKISSTMDSVTGILGELGTRISQLDSQKDKLSTDKMNFTRLISNIEDTDIADAVIKLERDKAVYQAALKTNANLIKSTLMDYL